MAGIYIHIPFCSRRCLYCDFYSNTDMAHTTGYLEAVKKELETRRTYMDGEMIRTIYLGGGTPSQLSPHELRQIFNSIYSHYEVDPDAEVTLEVNPDDITTDYLTGLNQVPVNRISMGIQSFDNGDLTFLNRRHTATQAIEAVSLCKEYGYYNISVDLIYGLPGQTLEAWEKNIGKALEMKIPHLSAYSLTYEEGTPLYKLKEKGIICPADEELHLSQFRKLIDQTTRAGYQHYEISNFAKEGYISQHNSSYWTGKKYLGIGASAHSFNGISRQWNISSIQEYIRGMKEEKPVIEIEDLDDQTGYNDSIITGLRTIWGIDLEQIRMQFGITFYNYCLEQAAPYIHKNLLTKADNKLTLTREGIFISDAIMSDLMMV